MLYLEPIEALLDEDCVQVFGLVCALESGLDYHQKKDNSQHDTHSDQCIGHAWLKALAAFPTGP